MFQLFAQGGSQFPGIMVDAADALREDGSWLHLYDVALNLVEGTFQYPSCKSLSPGDAADYRSDLTDLIVPKRLKAALGREPTIALSVKTVCIKDGQKIWHNLLTEPFTVRLPDHSN